MGKSCTIHKERGGNCTAFDGILPNGKNGWEELRKVIKKIPCDSCREDGLENLSGLQDIVNISIGERDEPFDYENLKKFVKKLKTVWDFVEGAHGVK